MHTERIVNLAKRIVAARLKSAFVLLLLLPNQSVAAKSNTEEAGLALAQAIYNRPDGSTAVIYARMTLRSAQGRDRTREFYNYRMDLPDGKVQALTRFTIPGNVAGVGLLVHSNPVAGDDQWLYLPALQRVRRISSESRGGRFVQSGLYYEDLRDRKPDQDEHRIISKSDYEGTPVTLLESIPVDPASSVYSRIVSWIHEPTLLPLRVEYFQGQETPVKYLEVKRLDRIEGYWTATESVITHPSTAEETVITNLATCYDVKLSENLFATNRLGDSSAESPCGP